MKILILTATFSPLGRSGHDERCLQVTRALAERGHRLQVLTSNYKVPPMGIRGEKAVYRDLNLQDRITDQDALPFSVIKNAEISNGAILAERIYKFKPDVIYIWGVKDLQSSLCLFAQNSGIAIVYDLHHSFGDDSAQTNDLWNYWWLQKPEMSAKLWRGFLTYSGLRRRYLRDAPLRKVDSFDFTRSYLCSESLKHQMLNEGFEQARELPVIYPVIAPKRLEQKTEYTPRKRFIWAGRFSSDKGVEVALESIKILNQRGTRVSLDLYGMGEPIERKQIRSIIDSEALGDQVNIKGIVFGELGQYYKEYNALLFTSRCDDPMPMTPLEAMYAGLPVLLSRDGGIQEVVESEATALTFERDDPEALADTIEAFLELPDSGRSMAENCIMKLQVDQSFTNYINTVEQLLEAALI